MPETGEKSITKRVLIRMVNGVLDNGRPSHKSVSIPLRLGMSDEEAREVVDFLKTRLPFEVVGAKVIDQTIETILGKTSAKTAAAARRAAKAAGSGEEAFAEAMAQLQTLQAEENAVLVAAAEANGDAVVEHETDLFAQPTQQHSFPLLKKLTDWKKSDKPNKKKKKK